jgi:hypothetical protein
MEVSAQLHAPAALPPSVRTPRYPLDRRLDGPQSRSGRGGEEKNSQKLPGLEPIKMDLKDVGCENKDWIHLTQFKV